MQIPISKISKFIPQWSKATSVTIFLYLLFITLVLTISFPLNSKKLSTLPIHQNGNRFFEDIESSTVFGDKEQKLLQKANEMASVHNRSAILREAFKHADLNGDLLLTLQELARYINERIRSHIETSIKKNPIVFSDIDRSPRNGLITWDEYYLYRIKSLGYDETTIRQKNLDRKTKDLLMKDKAMWNKAARSDSYSLTLDEFLAFQHPESSAANLLSVVDDLLSQFDEDGDELLTMEEFSNVATNDLDDNWRSYMIEKTVFQRQEEFRRLIDKNSDGVADRSELLSYVNPKHPRFALQEAAALFNLADRNKDHQLTYNELENMGNIFMASRMIDSSQSGYDDFF